MYAQSLINSNGITHKRIYLQILGPLCKHTQTEEQNNSVQLEIHGFCEWKNWCTQIAAAMC